MCFQLALLGWNSPGPNPGPLPPVPNVPRPHSCWAPALGQAWGAQQHTASSSSFIKSIPWSGTEPGSPGPLPSLSEGCYSGNLKTLAQKRVSKRRLEGGGDEGWWGVFVVNSPALPFGIRPQSSGFSYAVGSGCCFCRVILSCPEGSWPKATFLVGCECHRVWKLALTSPLRLQPCTQGWSLSSLCRQQTLSSQAVCVAQGSGPPSTLSSARVKQPWCTSAGGEGGEVGP